MMGRREFNKLRRARARALRQERELILNPRVTGRTSSWRAVSQTPEYEQAHSLPPTACKGTRTYH